MNTTYEWWKDSAWVWVVSVVGWLVAMAQNNVARFFPTNFVQIYSIH
jgi:hypothetical protein